MDDVTLDDVTLDELLADDYHEDPVTHETRWGEGWTRETWRQHFIEQGFGNG